MALMTTSRMLTMMSLPTNVPAITTRYDALRLAAEQTIKDYVKWGLEQVTVTEFYNGNGLSELALRWPFASAVGGLWLDPKGYYGKNPSGSFGAGTQLTEGRDFSLRYEDPAFSKSGVLVRLAGTSGMFLSDWMASRWAGTGFRSQPGWTYGQGNLKVTYTYGFAPGNVPSSIEDAVCQTVAITAGSNKLGFPIQSEGIGARNYSLMGISKPPEFSTVRQILSRYRDTSLGM